MTIIAMVILFVVLAAGLLSGAVLIALVLARRGQQQYVAQGELQPGRPSVAPPEWAGAHSEEARLHRRLGEALRGLSAASTAAGGAVDGGSLDLRVQVELRAEDLDRRLVAAAVLPAHQRDAALGVLSGDVATLEEVAGGLGQRLALGGASPDAPALEQLGRRLRELDGPPAG